MQIVIDGDKTLKLSAQHVAIVLDSLANLPFRTAQPVITEIFKQIEGQGSTEDSKDAAA